MSNRQLVDGYFAAMRRGAAAESEMMELFADDAVYVEPFIGGELAVGKAAIRELLRRGWEFPLPDLEIDGAAARTRWECVLQGSPVPSGAKIALGSSTARSPGST
jgi:ketosteroid isomerase-like protein